MKFRGWRWKVEEAEKKREQSRARKLPPGFGSAFAGGHNSISSPRGRQLLNSPSTRGRAAPFLFSGTSLKGGDPKRVGEVVFVFHLLSSGQVRRRGEAFESLPAHFLSLPLAPSPARSQQNQFLPFLFPSLSQKAVHLVVELCEGGELFESIARDFVVPGAASFFLMFFSAAFSFFLFLCSTRLLPPLSLVSVPVFCFLSPSSGKKEQTHPRHVHRGEGLF